MSKYASDHAGALADITEAGTAVTFTDTDQGDYDPITGESTVTTTTVSGYAIRVRGKPMTYEALGLIESSSPTLLFAPDTYGDTPLLGATCVWSGESYTVVDVNPLEPDGTALLARVVIQSGGV